MPHDIVFEGSTEQLRSSIPTEAPRPLHVLGRAIQDRLLAAPEEFRAILARVLALTEGRPTVDRDVELLEYPKFGGESPSPLATAVRLAGREQTADYFREATELADSGALLECPRVGVGVPIVLTSLGRGVAAREWLMEARLSVAPRGLFLLSAVLGMDHFEVIGPIPSGEAAVIVWAEIALAGGRRIDAARHASQILLGKTAVEFRDRALRVLALSQPLNLRGLAERLPEDMRPSLAEIALWSGDLSLCADLLPESICDEVSARTEVGHHLLNGDTENALRLARAHRSTWPSSTELALWETEALLRLGNAQEAEENLREQSGVHGNGPVQRLLTGITTLRQTGPGDPTDYFWTTLCQQVLGRPVGRDDEAAILETLERFGGNRSESLSVACAEGIRPITLREPRAEIIRLQHRVLSYPIDEVMAGILEFEREFPEVPIGPTYRAELELFRGNYEVAEELFTESWRTTRTRWSYVGRGGSLVLQGRYKEALAVFAEGEEYLSGYIDGEATHAYVGEAYLRLGDLESARKHLQFAVEVGRSRLGALLVMAQLELACGDPAPAADLLARAQFLAPALMWEASRDGPSMEDEIGNALGMLKGNRSSNLATFQDRKGVWRVTRLVWGDGVRARTQASQSGTYADELWTLMNAE